MKLHLGCGRNKLKGYLNCDISRDVRPDKILDLEKKLPFKDDTVDEILIEHVLEHIRNFIPLMHEFYRVCKKGAKIIIKVPFYLSCEQNSDSTHVRSFSPFSFDYFDADSRIGIYSHEVGARKTLFKVNNVKINYGVGRVRRLNWIFNPLINLNHMFYCKFFAGILTASEIQFKLEVLK